MYLKPLTWFLIQPASVKFRADEASCATIGDYVELAFSWDFFGLVKIKPFQVKEEIVELLNMVKALRPKSILEIGTASGGTVFLFSRVAKADARIITVNMPPKGLFRPDYVVLKSPMYRSFALGRQKITVIIEDSHHEETHGEVQEIMGGECIDFLFIDGDHSYEGVKKDFEMYSSLVRRGGMVAFHDIVPHPPESGCGVPPYWGKLKKSYTHAEIVKDWNQGWAGIGVLYL